jgi:hypothetical protein
MGNKRNASVGMFYLYTMMVVVAFLVLTSCSYAYTSRSQREARAKARVEASQYQGVRSITVVDINGDTIVITGGATCHLDKKL